MNKKERILVLPGWTYVEEKTLPLVERLRGLGYEVTLLKVPGLTGEKLRRPWTLEDYRVWLEKMLELEVKAGEQVTLMGHSNGGRIILKFLSTESEQQKKVGKVVLLDSAGVKDLRCHVVLKRDLMGLLSRCGRGLKKNKWLRKMVYKVVRERDYYQAEPVMQKTMANMLAEDLRGKLRTVEKETLLVWGENDQMTPLCLGREMAAKMPRARLVMIAGARHTPQFTHLEETVAAVTDFLAEGEEEGNGEV